MCFPKWFSFEKRSFLKNLHKNFLFVNKEWTKRGVKQEKNEGKCCMEALKIQIKCVSVSIESIDWPYSELQNICKMISCLTPIGRCLQALQFPFSRKEWIYYWRLKSCKGLVPAHIKFWMNTYRNSSSHLLTVLSLKSEHVLKEKLYNLHCCSHF